MAEAIVQEVDGFPLGLGPRLCADESAVEVEVGPGGHRFVDDGVGVSGDADPSASRRGVRVL